MSQELLTTLKPHASAESLTWLESTLSKTRSEFSEHPFYYAFSGATRHFDKTTLIDGIPSDQLARKSLLLALAEQPKDTFLATLEKLLGSADIREAVVLYSTFADLPHPEDLLVHAREATRSNVIDIFDAIALDNSFPRDHFPEEAWNQLVLKSLFISRPLYRMVGLEERANAHLAKQISDLAHERWAAGRELNPEAWHCCLDFLDEQTILTDLQSLAERSENEKRALALLWCHQPENATKLAEIEGKIENELTDINSIPLTWDWLGRSVTNET